MQIQVHTNDNIQGGESLIRWAQDEAAAAPARREQRRAWSCSCPTWTRASPAGRQAA